MKSRGILKGMMVYGLVSLLWTQSFASDLGRVVGHLQETTFLSYHLKDFVQKYNKRYQTVGDSIRFLQKHFPRDDDIKYLEKVRKELSLNDTEPLPPLRVKGDHIFVEKVTRGTKIQMEISVPNTFNQAVKINGITYRHIPGSSLEKMHKKIVGILKQTHKRSVSLIDFIIPSAHALAFGIAVGVLIVALHTGISVYFSWQENNQIEFQRAVRITNRQVKDLKAQCEDRNHSVPFEKSQLYRTLENIQIMKNGLFQINEFEKFNDCAKFVPNAHKETKGRITLNELIVMCRKVQRISECVKDYKSAQASKLDAGRTNKPLHGDQVGGDGAAKSRATGQ